MMNKNNILMLIYKSFCFSCLFILLFLNTLHLWRGDLQFHADIARDFLVMNDMIENHKLTLIGPKSGGISGVFHGPAWYYLNLPLFIFVKGNPAGIAVFWLFLYLIGLSAFYYFSKKMFSKNIALATTTLFASLSIFMPQGFLQCTPATLLVVPAVFFLWRYLNKHHFLDLIITLFLIGMIIQFQMAFGVPILIPLSVYILYDIVKNKNYKHLFCFFILFLPLSTFIFFDLRHEFLQTHAVINYFTTPNLNDDWNFKKYLFERWQAISECFRLISNYKISSVIGLATVFLTNFFYKKMDKKIKLLWIVSAIIIFGFWLITIPFRGRIYGFYYGALLPLLCLWWTWTILNFKKAGTSLIVIIIAINLFFGIRSGLKYIESKDTNDSLYWKFYRQMTNDVFKDSNHENFSYYAWTPDQLGYPIKYAMIYKAKQLKVEISSYQKLPLTYLLIAKNDAEYNPWVNPIYWRTNQVKILREANSSWSYSSGFTIKKYFLNEEEILVEDDPNLIDGLQFR